MAVTRSTAAERAETRPVSRSSSRVTELISLVMGSLVIGVGLWLVLQAKLNPANVQPTLNLRQLERQEQLLPLLTMFPNAADKEFAAHRIFEYVTDHGNNLPNIGALARIRVREHDIQASPKLDSFRKRLPQGTPANPDATIALLTPAHFSQLKPLLAVRDAASFQRSFLLWSGLFLAGFFAVHLLWMLRGFTGEQGLLPVVQILCGMGLILMTSLRDPLRDTLAFSNFAQGVAGGCVLLAALSFVDFNRLSGGLSFLPLLLSLALSAALILFGSGPGTSDAKVNLLGVQPVEAIKLLLVFFLAGYFSSRWEFLRELREKRPSLAKFSRWVEIPRLEYVLPVVVSIAFVLLFFFLQKDLGPALVFSFVFLALYAVARNRVVLSGIGILVLISGFAGGFWLGHPRTVSDRVQMWLSPWNNNVHGGDQIAHSLWALGSGGAAGMGLGLGEPGYIPAGHTDLILAALGEEWGFAGLLAAMLLFALMLWLAWRITMKASNEYSFFLCLGLTLLTALQLFLISAGILGLAPLSGVVTPFLSFGRTSMLANFVVIAILLSVSHHSGPANATEPFRGSVRAAAWVVGILLTAIVAKAAYVQTAAADAIAGTGALIIQADGGRRYEYNPRLMEIARMLPRGSIRDRNGLPLATSNWAELESNRQKFAAMGIDIDKVTNRAETRHYPLGGSTYPLLGDLRTRLNWTASNTSYQERDSAVQLQGYDDRARVVEVKDFRTGQPAYAIRYDYRELLPLLRHRNEPDDPAVKRILGRNRDVQMSIDARLQWQASSLLRAQLEKLGQQKGSLVVMDPDTGDLLAAASEPSPTLDPNTHPENDVLLDRARYGLFPPGSTFKIVTAMAALRVNPELANQTFDCIALPDGRVGNYVGNSHRPIRDDAKDHSPHGTLNMERAIAVSCNAYFAQLGAYKVGAQALFDTAGLLGIAVAKPASAAQLKNSLPQASYGQGQVVASPFQMARVAATIAAGGTMPYGRWVTDDSNSRQQPPQPVLAPNLAAMLGRDMRLVVTSGTGSRLAGAPVPVAGKTGTAELENAPSHAWFIGYAPYGVSKAKRIAFAVLIENGQYGGTAAAPLAGDIVSAAVKLGLVQGGTGK